MDWNFDLWMASLDLRKALNKIEYDSLFGALGAQGVPLNMLICLQAFTKIKQVQWKEAWLFLYNAV